MNKFRKMITLLGIVLLCIFLMVSFSGANPAGQARTLPPVKPDVNVSLPVPKVFLTQALKDSLEKRDKLVRENDSLSRVRKHKSDKIIRLIHNLVHKKARVIKDTVYIPAIMDTAFNKDINYLHHVKLIQCQ